MCVRELTADSARCAVTSCDQERPAVPKHTTYVGPAWVGDYIDGGVITALQLEVERA